MFSRLGQIADRYFITLAFAILGWVNAQSWQYLLVFVVFAAAIDIWLVKPRPIVPEALLADGEKRAIRAGWYTLLFIAIGCQAVALAMSITTAGIARNSPETIQEIGPILYQYASPFIALLRNHYADLADRGFLARANLVAFVYTEFFLLFYISLAVWMVRFRNSRVMDHPRIEVGKLRKQRLASIILLSILSLCLLFSLYLTAWIEIDYSDHSFGRHHTNTNLAQYNSFFFDLVLGMTTFGFFAPLSHMVLRSLPLMFVRNTSKPQRIA